MTRTLKMSAAQWIRDGDAILAAGPVDVVELTTTIETLLPEVGFAMHDDPEMSLRLQRGERPALVMGRGWNGARWVNYGFKFWLTPATVRLIPALKSSEELLTAVWPGVRFVLSGTQPRTFLDEPPDDPASQTLSPPAGNAPPPTGPGESHPWRPEPAPLVVKREG